MPIKQEPLRYAHDEGHTDVCFSSDGSKFITCGADGDIRIWPVDESEDPIHICVGELALSICYSQDTLYVSTGNNDVQILTFPDGERNGVLARFTAPINQLTTSGKAIALAGEDMKVRLIINLEESKDVTLFEGLTGPCLSVALCPQMKYLASSSGDSKLRVWDITSKVLVKEISCFAKVNSFANAKTLNRLDFAPKSGRFLAYPDKNSVILLNTADWSEYATLNAPQTQGDYSIVQFSPCGQYIGATTTSGDFIIWNIENRLVESRTKHEKSLNITGFMWNPNESNQIVFTDSEGQLGVLSGCTPQIEARLEPEIPENGSVASRDSEEASDDDDGENVISVEKLKKQFMGNHNDDDSESELNFGGRAPSPPRARTPEVPMQPPFMPSSTPEHLNPRYLCWNDVGIIRGYGSLEDDDAAKSIEVEFHESSLHNSIMVQNYQDYTMGAVSKTALVVANPSQINVIPLMINAKDWILKVDEREEVLLVAASENLVCFATSAYIVRIASTYGTQRGVVSIPGPLVTMSAFKNTISIAYHRGGVRRNDQNIGVMLVEVSGFSLRSKDIGCTLGPGATLLWLGFSDCGTPTVMDSLGMLSMYPLNCETWVPFCDTSKHRGNLSDGFFVTAVFESFQTVAGIKCRGTVYPSLAPRPNLCELPLEPPFAELSTEKTQLEMALFASSSLHLDNPDKKIKETGLKCFALACRNDLDQRAVEVMEVLSNPQVLQLGIKYSMKLDKRRLAEKLMDLASKLIEDDEEGDDDITEAVIEPNAMVKPKKLSLGAPNKRRTIMRQDQGQIHQPPDGDVIPSTQSQEIESQPLESLTNESLTTKEGGKNPFLKSRLPLPNDKANPLSLVDKMAGVDFDFGHSKSVDTKRKKAEGDGDKRKSKQRKLDKFMFPKRT